MSEKTITCVQPKTTVTLLRGITSSIDTVLTFHITLERRIAINNIETWEIVHDFGIQESVSVPGRQEFLFSTVYGPIEYYVEVEAMYRWNVLVYAVPFPETTRENFYSYFNCEATATSGGETTICDDTCNFLPNQCDSDWMQQTLEEYFCLRGFPVTIYLVTKFSPIYVFGEDPSKKYGASFTTKAIWDISPENLTLGKWEKTSNEPVQLYLNISMVKKQIKNALLDVGVFSPFTANYPDSEVSKEESWRRELQEQDMLRTDYNNIHYEIDSVKREPEYVYWLNKYVYWVTARPRLVAGEDLGSMQPVTDAEEIRQEHDMEIRVESEKILF
jgi:hypothetical protein